MVAWETSKSSGVHCLHQISFTITMLATSTRSPTIGIGLRRTTLAGSSTVSLCLSWFSQAARESHSHDGNQTKGSESGEESRSHAHDAQEDDLGGSGL